jgi:putative transposase
MRLLRGNRASARLERIPVNEAESDHSARAAWAAPDLVCVPEKEWREAVKKFKIVKPLLAMEDAKRTLADVEKTARALGRHPVTVYRWIENYRRTGRLSVFLRKERADRGTSRLSNRVDKIIDTAIKKIYLTAERPDVTAVIE